jgi:hypothetical protein
MCRESAKAETLVNSDTNTDDEPGPPFVWDPARRFQLRCELDAAFFHLYGIARDDVEYVSGTDAKYVAALVAALRASC